MHHALFLDLDYSSIRLGLHSKCYYRCQYPLRYQIRFHLLLYRRHKVICGHGRKEGVKNYISIVVCLEDLFFQLGYSWKASGNSDKTIGIKSGKLNTPRLALLKYEGVLYSYVSSCWISILCGVPVSGKYSLRRNSSHKSWWTV